MAEPPNAEIAARVRAARAYAGMGQLDLAAAMEVSRPVIVDIEAGRRPVKRSERMVIAEATGLPLAFFYGDFSAMSETRTPAAEQAAAPEGERLPVPRPKSSERRGRK